MSCFDLKIIAFAELMAVEWFVLHFNRLNSTSVKRFFIVAYLFIALLPALPAMAQEADPNSTPPGAPMVDFGDGDIAGRLIPDHPGNAGQKVQSSNFAIIESQSFNVGHDMDVEWRNLLQGMGHTATIYPQTTLDNTGFFAAHDALIVSSGVIALPASRQAIIQQFMQTGKPVYLQGEWQISYTTNQGFRNIINATGGSFTLGGTVSGSLVPTNILNLYATTPNVVSSISYHWYGASGSGCDNVEYFMRFGANNIGFVYCPTNNAWGDMVQSTDQDWVRATTSPALMQNIVFALLSGNACSVVCGTIVLEAQHLDLQARRRDDQQVDLMWSLDGEPVAGTFVVECNGEELSRMSVSEGDGIAFQYSDVRMPAGELRYRVRHLDMNGDETLSGETLLTVEAAAPTLRVANTQSGFTVRMSQGNDLESLWLTSINGEMQKVDTGELHSSAGQKVLMQEMAEGIYFLRGITKSGQAVQAKVIWMR